MNPSLANHTLLHRNFIAAYDAVLAIVHRALNGEKLIGAVWASSRNGKSTLAMRVTSEFPARSEEGRRIVTVIYVTTPVRPTKKNLAEALLEMLDARAYGRQSADQATARLRLLLRSAQTRVIILDEVQHIVERHAARGAYEVADWLKTLSDELGLTLILLGLPSAQSILDGNPQLRERANVPHLFYPYNWNDSADRTEFRRCLLTLGRLLQEQGWECSDWSDLQWARRFYASSVGRYGMLVKLLDCAKALAQSSSLRQISLKILQQAHDISIATGVLSQNPFDPEVALDDTVLVRCFVEILTEAGLKPQRQGIHQTRRDQPEVPEGGDLPASLAAHRELRGLR